MHILYPLPIFAQFCNKSAINWYLKRNCIVVFTKTFKNLVNCEKILNVLCPQPKLINIGIFPAVTNVLPLWKHSQDLQHVLRWAASVPVNNTLQQKIQESKQQQNKSYCSQFWISSINVFSNFYKKVLTIIKLLYLNILKLIVFDYQQLTIN